MKLIFNKSLMAMSVAALLAMTSQANAGLIKSTDGNLIYDDISDITWLADLGYGGKKTWPDSLYWADNLAAFGSSDWRLAAIDEGLDLQNSLADLGLFNNMPANDNNGKPPQFWTSSTRNTSNGLKTSWFSLTGTILSAEVLPQSSKKYAWAVVSGDFTNIQGIDSGVDATVPEPVSIAIFGLGLAGLVYRRKQLLADKKVNIM